MIGEKRKTLSLLAITAVLTAGCSVVGGGLAWSSTAAAADQPAAQSLAETLRQFDAMGGSGSAGIDADQAKAITAAEQADMVGDVIFSVPSGTFQGQVSVSLSTTIEGAEIRYTTNGAEPTTASTLYQGSPLVFTKTTQLRAQAVVAGAATGAPGTAIYAARSVDATHDLPLVLLDAYGGGKPGKDYKDVSVMVVDTQGGPASLSKAPAVATRAGFHVRGQSSANFEKTPYRLELRDNLNKDADYPLLGMPADSDWALRGPFPDKTLVRDAFSYGIGREMGLQAPRYAFVELYLNLDSQPMAANDYQGVYLLVETIKRSPDRLNIQKLKKTDLSEPAISGGYMMQINVMAAEPPTLACTGSPCWSDLELFEPNELQPAQKTWITNYIQKFHNSLRSTNPSNPQTGYPAYIDVDSFVNQIVLNELAREGDSYMRSQHFYKDRGGKLFVGPLWDYDLGYEAFTGMMGMPGGSTSTVQGWQYQPMFGMGSGSDWFVKLMADPTFLAKVKTRWQTLRKGVLSDAQMTARMTALTTPLTNGAARNFQKWPNLGTSTVGGFGTQVTQTWQQQVQIMRTFLTQRAAWLDQSANWGGGTGPTDPPQGNKACSATIAKAETWSDRFNSTVTVKAGNAAITNWTVTVRLSSSQTIQNSWNGTASWNAATLTLTMKSSGNGSLAAGATTPFGFTTMANGNTTLPTITSCTAS